MGQYKMCIDKDKLGKRFKEKRNEKPKSIPTGIVVKSDTWTP